MVKTCHLCQSVRTTCVKVLGQQSHSRKTANITSKPYVMHTVTCCRATNKRLQI